MLRLENASWRKFFQMRFNLPKIRPSELNWQKDSDACWLYGPFHAYESLHELQAQYDNEKECYPNDYTDAAHMSITDFHVEASGRRLKSALKKRQNDNLIVILDKQLTRTLSDDVLFARATLMKSVSPETASPPADYPQLKETYRKANFYVSDTFEANKQVYSEYTKKIRFDSQVQQRLILGSHMMLSDEPGSDDDEYLQDLAMFARSEEHNKHRASQAAESDALNAFDEYKSRLLTIRTSQNMQFAGQTTPTRRHSYPDYGNNSATSDADSFVTASPLSANRRSSSVSISQSMINLPPTHLNDEFIPQPSVGVFVESDSSDQGWTSIFDRGPDESDSIFGFFIDCTVTLLDLVSTMYHGVDT